MDYLLNLINIPSVLDCTNSVLNLIINGLPSKHLSYLEYDHLSFFVLNLIINGLPSKLLGGLLISNLYIPKGFKPYYKWTTF